MPSPLRLVVLPALLIACAHPSPASSPTPSSPLASVRAATGGDRWDTVQVIESRGTIAVGGMTGPFTSIDDVVSGRSRNELTLGGHRFADGFDGTAAWSQDPGGEVVAPDAPPAVAQARTQAWVTRRGYFHAAGARYRDLGRKDAGGRGYQVVEATPDGGSAIELWVDPATHLLARTVQKVAQDTVVTTLDDYRDIGGVRVAHRVVVDRGDERDRATVTVTSASLRGALAEAAWARPATDTDRVSFTGAQPTSAIPFDLINNHIYVNGTVDGKPVRLLVDTGGVNLLTPAAARRLGLAAEGQLRARGVGEQTVDLALAKGKQLTVGEVALRDPVFYVIDLGSLPDVEGHDADGLVGFELFHRLGVRIDYPAQVLTLSSPDTFRAPAGAIAVPFQLRERIPIVDGTIDGIAARFTVDTGSRASLTAHAPFVRQHGLVERYQPRFETVGGWGVGGPVRTSPVRFTAVTVGGATVRAVAGDLFRGEAGAFADPDAAANLGGGVLRRFVVSFDYRASTMYLEPGPAIDARDPYDRVGLFLMRAGDALRIAAVTPGGPAEKVGLTVDDRIVMVDGAPVTSRTLAAWRAAFREGAVGSRLHFAVERAGKRRAVAVTLVELLP